MNRPNRSRLRKAFTVVELLIVIAVLTLLAILVVKGSVRARQRHQASLTLKEVEELDAAKRVEALNHPPDPPLDMTRAPTPVPPPKPLTFDQLTPYLKSDSPLRARNGKDVLGNEFILGVRGLQPKVSPSTQSALSAVTGGDAFWGPYL